MAKQITVDEIVAEIESLSADDRQALLIRMASMDDILEELGDVADLLRTAQEQSRPYEEFLGELRAEGRDL